MAENGPWSSENTQQFILPLWQNLHTVMAASEAAVLAEVNGGDAMDAYKVRRYSRWVNGLFPAISVIPRRVRTRKNEDGPLIEEVHGFEILIEDVGADPDDLAFAVVKRVNAAHIIIERASLASLFAGYEAPKTKWPYWDIDHDYAAFFNEAKSYYKQNGSLILTFTGLMEKT